MSKEMIVSSTSVETKVAILEDDQLTELFVERTRDRGILGNIYKGRVTKVLPGMQAAFVDIGLERDAFLYVSDFVEDYDEYEHLFSEVEAKVEQLLQEAGYSEEAPAERKPGRRRGRGRGRGQRPRGKAAPGAVRQTAAEKVPIAPGAELVEHSVEDLSSHRESILVDTFPVPEALPAAQSSSAGDPQSGQPDILPDRLEPPATYEPEKPPQERLSDQEARLEEKGEIHHLATKKGSGRPRRRRTANRGGNTRTLIGDLLREGQEILVQVAKEPIARKGARITSHVALPGRYVVFMPTVDHIGVSRRIMPEKERQRLKDIIVRLRGDFGKGFIVRTAGEKREEQDFRQDMIYLTRLWTEIRSKAEKLSAPALVHSELHLVQRVLRDYFTEDFRVIRADDKQEYERVVDFVSKISPQLVQRVRLYSKDTPVFDEYGVNGEIEKALKQKVWLKNGGYIVINQTEALVAIDVNTGKFVGRTASLEDTITKTNLDAVKEVVRQIRLRDLGGIIVIDFIDMDDRRNQQKVMETLQNELARDKAPCKILPFNEFGLVAITRKRVKQSLERILCQPCLECNGTGMTKSVRTICYSIRQEVRRMLPHLGAGAGLVIHCHPEVGRALRERERPVVAEIEEMARKAVSIKTEALLHIEQFDIVEV